MPVLADFLSVQKVEKKEQQKDYSARLRKFRKAVDLMSETFDCSISAKSDLGRQIIEKESEVFQDYWDDVGFIPKVFEYSCLNTKTKYSYLSDFSQYPVVQVSDLKQMADTLSFVILPIDYINMEKIFEMYEDENYSYADKIREAYEEFKEVVSKCADFTGKQQLYMLAPISFYDPWEEVSCSKLLPKYFSKKLVHLSTTLGMIIPTQRNIYRMVNTTDKNLRTLQQNMKDNFEAVERSINECHSRIDWVEDMTKSLERRVAEDESRSRRMELQLYNMHLEVTKLEHMLYCLLDPIIFAVDDDVDISSPDSNEEKAHVGLCFGPDMPVDFFLDKGMVTINDKRLKSITHILKI